MVNFEQISNIIVMFPFVNFEKVNAGWVLNGKFREIIG